MYSTNVIFFNKFEKLYMYTAQANMKHAHKHAPNHATHQT